MFKIISITLVLFLFVIVFTIYNPLEYSFFPKCPIYLSTGYLCPGCGSQRAIHNILNFEFYKATRHNLLIPLFIFYLFIYYLSKILNLKISRFVDHHYLLISFVFLIVLYGFIRNII